jgi:uncharacterized protein YdeI (BOF family)
MKNLLAILLTSFLVTGTAFAEDVKAPAKEETKAADFKEGEVKKVCVVINGKEKCKNMKMHHKVEGTKIPTPVKKGK